LLIKNWGPVAVQCPNLATSSISVCFYRTAHQLQHST